MAVIMAVRCILTNRQDEPDDEQAAQDEAR